MALRPATRARRDPGTEQLTRELITLLSNSPLADVWGPPSKQRLENMPHPILSEIYNFVGPSPDQFRTTDFETVWNYMRDQYAQFTTTTVLQSLEVLSSPLKRLFRWVETDKKTFIQTILSIPPAIAKRGGPQAITAGLEFSSRQEEFTLNQIMEGFMFDMTHLREPAGLEAYDIQRKSLVLSLLRRVDRDAFIMMCNHEPIRRFLQDQAFNNDDTSVGELLNRYNANTFPVQRGGYRKFTAVHGLMRTDMHKLDPSAEPDVWYVPEGVKHLMAVGDKATDYSKSGPRINAPLDKIGDTFDTMFKPEVDLLELTYNSQVKDTERDSRYEGTPYTIHSFSGWMASRPDDVPLTRDYKTSHRSIGFLDMRTNKVELLTLAELEENCGMFSSDGSLSPTHWDVRHHFNSAKGRQIPEAFKATSMMMYKSRDTGLWQVGRVLGDFLRDQDVENMIFTLINCEKSGFSDSLRQRLRAAIGLHRELAHAPIDAQSFAIRLAALRQAGDRRNLRGTVDLPYFAAVPGTTGMYWVYYYDDANNRVYIGANGADGATLPEGDRIVITQDHLTGSGWSDVSGIYTLADLRHASFGSEKRRFINDETVKAAWNAAQAIDEFANLIQTKFPELAKRAVAGLGNDNRTGNTATDTSIAIGNALLFRGIRPFYIRRSDVMGPGAPTLQAPVAEVSDEVLALRELLPPTSPVPAALLSEENFATFVQRFATTALGIKYGGWEGFRRKFLGSGNERAQKAIQAALAASVDRLNAPGVAITDATVTRFTPSDEDRAVINRTILGAVPQQTDSWVNTHLYLDADSFRLGDLPGGLGAHVRRSDPLTRKVSRGDGIPSDNEHTDIHALSFVGSQASGRVEPGAEFGYEDAMRFDELEFLSPNLYSNVENWLSRVADPVEKALVLAIALSPNVRGTWAAFRAQDVYYPATFKVLVPSRRYEVGIGVMADTRVTRNVPTAATLYNMELSNTQTSKMATRRAMHVQSDFYFAVAVFEPRRIMKHHDFTVNGYKGGETKAFFNEAAPFDPTTIDQPASLMSMMMPTDAPLAIHSPITGQWSPVTLALGSGRNQSGSESVDVPTHGSALFYTLYHGFDKLPPPVVQTKVDSFNKDSQVYVSGIGHQMWHSTFEPSTGRYSNIIQPYDQFGPELSYPGCAPARSMSGVTSKNA